MLKKSEKLYVIVTIIILLGFLITYFLSPEAQININRSLSMLRLEDMKGILMYYYGLNSSAFLSAIGIMTLQTLLPVLSKSAIVYANYKFFGYSLGILLSTVGILIALFISYATGKSLYLLLRRFFKLKFEEVYMDKYGTVIIFFISILPIWPSAMVGYIAGITNIKLKKFLPAAIIGHILCLLIFFKWT